MNCPVVPISIGELIDKITFSRSNLNTLVVDLFTKNSKTCQRLQDLGVYKKEYLDKLLEVNRKLWDIEDDLRIRETNSDFGDEFVRLCK